MKAPGAAIPVTAAETRSAFMEAFERALEARGANATDLVETGIRGMVAGLGDPETTWVGPDEMRRLQMAVPDYALGLVFSDLGGAMTIRRIIPETPAARIGLRAGDVILAIDGVPIAGLALNEVRTRLRSRQPSRVTVAVRRADVADTMTFETERAIIVDPEVVATRDGDIGVIIIRSFSRTTPDDVREAVESLKQAGARGIVLDLRGNPGGLWDAMMDVADLFLEAGPIASVRPSGPCAQGDASQSYEAGDGDEWNGRPLVVLIDHETGSGGEIFAAALGDRRRATLIGQRTAGKGVIAVLVPVGGRQGGALKLHTGDLYTAGGLAIAAQGVAPTEETPPANGSGDPTLARAIALLRGQAR